MPTATETIIRLEEEARELRADNERLRTGLKMLADDCEATAQELVHERERRPWLSVVARIRRALD